MTEGFKKGSPERQGGQFGMPENPKQSAFATHLDKGLDLKVEGTLVTILEQKYQEIARELDKQEMIAKQATFK